MLVPRRSCHDGAGVGVWSARQFNPAEQLDAAFHVAGVQRSGGGSDQRFLAKQVTWFRPGPRRVGGNNEEDDAHRRPRNGSFSGGVPEHGDAFPGTLFVGDSRIELTSLK